MIDFPLACDKSQKKISKVASDERAKDEIIDIFYDTPFYASSPFDRRIETTRLQHQPQAQFAVCEKALGLRTIYLRVRVSILPNPIRNTRSFRTS